MLEDRGLLGVELDPIDELRSEPIDEIDDPLILELVVDPNGGEIGRELITKYPLNQVEITVNDRRRLDPL